MHFSESQISIEGDIEVKHEGLASEDAIISPYISIRPILEIQRYGRGSDGFYVLGRNL